MQVLIVLVSLLSLALAKDDPGAPAGKGEAVGNSENNFDGRIIGGQWANPNQYPWQAAIFHTVDGESFFCGGAVINNEWILTAAHCVEGASNFDILLGATDVSIPGSGSQRFGVSEAIIHPQYNQPSSLNNDTALLRLNKTIQFTNQVKSIPLSPSGSNLPDNVDVTISGWGTISDYRNYFEDKLRYVSVKTISNAKCAPYYNGLIQSNMVCTDSIDSSDSRRRKGICTGDSGGPLVRLIDNVWVHVGIASFVGGSGCKSGFPNGYIRTAAPNIRSFIKQHTGV